MTVNGHVCTVAPIVLRYGRYEHPLDDADRMNAAYEVFEVILRRSSLA